MQYHATPFDTVQHGATPCNNMQYHAIPCNTIEYLQLQGAHHSFYGRLWPHLQPQRQTMGLLFKPAKCRSLSIIGGRVDGKKSFFLQAGWDKVFLKTMEDDPHKSLGSTLPPRKFQPTTSSSLRPSWRRNWKTCLPLHSWSHAEQLQRGPQQVWVAPQQFGRVSPHTLLFPRAGRRGDICWPGWS